MADTKKKSQKSSDKKKITKNKKVSEKKYKKMKDKAGGSSVGKYSNVSKSEFAGPAGGAPEGSYPINTKDRAKSAIRLAHNAPNPAGIRQKVFKKYPDLYEQKYKDDYTKSGKKRKKSS